MIERIKQIEKEMSKILYFNNDDISAIPSSTMDEYIQLINFIENKNYQLFTKDEIKKYPYIERIADYINFKFLSNNFPSI